MRMTRRQLVQRGAAGATILSLPGLLAACGGGGAGGGVSGGSSDTLRFANWQLYIDIDEKTKKSPTLQQFTAQTGIPVEYFEEINSNDEYFGKIQGPLSKGDGIDREIIVLTDNSRYPGLMIGEEWVLELDREQIPNIDNLIDVQQSPPFDPDRTYSLPWQSGMTGIAYNEKLTSTPITSMEQVLTDPALKGKVTLLNEMADTVGLVMQLNGADPAEVTDESFDAAITPIQEAVDNGQIRQFTGNDYTGPLAKGDLIAAVAWSGDLVQLQADNPSLKWTVPDDGAMIWTDNMLIPLGGDVEKASTFMNFVYDPKIAAQIAAYVNYVTPVKGAREELLKSDPDLANNQLIFPDDTTLEKVKQFNAEALNNQDYIERWQALAG
ncbi:MAG TPA: spermidine/putrescine ABC transporter substrate-binding protein [Gaiella sp.]|nr:spermidine/putrescine ABC transporter substrate-binding protein [Gaiella sp.]